MAGVQAQTEVTSKVEKATVYLNGATLTHTATAALKSGSQEVVITGLSPDIVLSSLKVTANGVLIASTEFSTDFLTLQEERTHIKKMEDSLEMYKQKRLDVINDLDGYQHLLKLLKEGTLHNMQQTQQTVSVADINANMELYKAKAGALQKSIDECDNKISQLNGTIQRLENQIKQDKCQGLHTQGVLHLSVSVPKALTTEFTITYFTEMAAWTPCYDLNIHDMEQQVTEGIVRRNLHAVGIVLRHVADGIANTDEALRLVAVVHTTRKRAVAHIDGEEAGGLVVAHRIVVGIALRILH